MHWPSRSLHSARQSPHAAGSVTRTSVGANLLSRPKASENTSAWRTHCSLPKRSIPPHVRTEYKPAIWAIRSGVAESTYTSSTHAKAASSSTPGHTPSPGGYRRWKESSPSLSMRR